MLPLNSRPQPRLSTPTRFRTLCPLALLLTLAAAAPAAAQLSTPKTYFAKDRPVEITVATPPALNRAVCRIKLFDPALVPPPPSPPVPIAESTVTPGKADLAFLFPTLWSAKAPKVLYAQLVAGGGKVGPPLVLQPLLAPATAAAADPRGLTVLFTQPPPANAYFSGLRVYPDRHALLETSAGEIEIRLRPDAAPNTVWNFRHLVEGGLYDGTIFHRVVGTAAAPAAPANTNAPNNAPPVAPNPDQGTGFMIQGGDPLGTGIGGPGYAIPLEKSPLPHTFGVLSMARLAQPNTGGSQFFIALSRTAAAPLDGHYAAFGQAVRGGEAIRAIAAVQTEPKTDRPLNPPALIRARLIDAPPFGEAPAPVKPGEDDGR
jgi:peptidyl-prolyl cis-trans isomerase B (cyclophilin B)